MPEDEVLAGMRECPCRRDELVGVSGVVGGVEDAAHAEDSISASRSFLLPRIIVSPADACAAVVSGASWRR